MQFGVSSNYCKGETDKYDLVRPGPRSPATSRRFLVAPKGCHVHGAGDRLVTARSPGRWPASTGHTRIAAVTVRLDARSFSTFGCALNPVTFLLGSDCTPGN